MDFLNAAYTKLIAGLTAVLSVVVGLFVMARTYKQKGRNEAESDAKDQLLEDIALKEEIQSEGKETIADGDRQSRIDRL